MQKISFKNNNIKILLRIITTNTNILYNPIILKKKYITKNFEKTFLKNNAINVKSNNLIKDIKTIKQKLNNKYNTIVIHNIEETYTKKSKQNDLSQIINILKKQYIQIIIITKKLPQETNNIYKNLKQQLSYGLTIQTNNQNLKSKIKILNSETKKFNTNINKNIIKFITQKIKKNKKILTNLIKYIIARSNESNIITETNSTKKLIYQQMQKKYISINKITETVIKYYDISYNNLKMKDKKKSITLIRQIIFYLCKKFTKNSLSEIGGFLEQYDHTTVLHSYNKIKKIKKENLKINKDISTLINKLTK